MNITEELSKQTYVIEHSPNCKSKYLVRLCGAGKGLIDKKPEYETEDILGFGDTLAEAATNTLSKKYKNSCVHDGANILNMFL